jgi:uncharacterized protein (AIM24 family)
MAFTIEEFVEATAQRDEAAGVFELENAYTLEVNMERRVWAKAGSMIGYTGAVKFTREGMTEHGVGKMLKKMVTGEGATLMKIEGRGRVYLADRGKRIAVLQLQEDSIVINGNDLLAFEEGLDWDITMMRKVAGMLSGGLFNIRLSGTGLVAFTTHYEPITLKVNRSFSVCTDPNATVAWSSSLEPNIKTDVSLKTIVGRGSGESIQLEFRGDGWVVLQPYEEVYLQG